jgi:YHS domain-containing protein
MTTATEHDVICHMDITIAGAAGQSEYEGRTYYFCAMGCKRDFDDDPTAALQAESEYDHSAPMDHGMAMSAPSGGEKKPWWKFW